MYNYIVHFANGEFTHVTAYNFSVLEPGEVVFTDGSFNTTRYERDVVKIIGALVP